MKIQDGLNYLRATKQELRYQLRDWWRIAFCRESYQQVINEKEIRIVGLKRSGNHALINWIRSQHSGEVWHLNNIRPHQNPYRNLYSHYPKPRLAREAWGDFVHKDCLIYSYEDYTFEQINQALVEKKHDLYLGKSAARYDVLIIRDPFNLIASRFKKDMVKIKFNNCNLVDLWIAYAREYLGETNNLSNQKICINYNRWFQDIDYRQQLAKQLNFTFSDAGINNVKQEGGGSSFDGQLMDGKANQMQTLSRWQHFADNQEYLHLVNNEQLRYYSEKIFGEMSISLKL